jgi:hypothetical protein
MNDEVNDKISEALNTTYDEVEILPAKQEEKSPAPQEDFDLVRSNLKEVINRGKEAIDGILNIASEGESPRAYEVASQLLRTVADANKDLLEMHKKAQEINASGKSTINKVTNNAIYVGSTKDLQQMMKQRKSTLKDGQIE